MEENKNQHNHDHGHSQHHHHRHEDYATRFKRKGLQSIEFRRKADKWLKISLLGLSVVMMLIVVIAYIFG